MKAPVATFTSIGGRSFTVGDGEHEERFKGDPLWSDTFPILFDGKPAGKLFRNERYGRTSDGKPRWQASTRALYWFKATDAPTGIGFDVAAFDTAEDALKAWARSADEILDWAEGKPVKSIYSKTGSFQKAMTDRPLAAPGLVSYRYRGRYGWIMIGAKDNDDALRQATRSITDAVAVVLDNLEIWNGNRYVPVNRRVPLCT